MIVSHSSLGVITLTSLLVVSLGGCSSSPFESVPALSKAEIIDRAFSLYGGPNGYLGLESLIQTSTVTISSGERTYDLPFRLEFSRPDRIRVESVTPDGLPLVQVYADGEARQWLNGAEQNEGLLASRMRRRLDYIFILGLLTTVPQDDIVLVGTPDVAERPTYALEIPRAESVITLFLDQQTFHLRRIRETINVGGDTQTQDFYLDQYRIVAGRPMPWRFVTVVDDQKVSEALMIDAKVGETIPAERFTGL